MLTFDVKYAFVSGTSTFREIILLQIVLFFIGFLFMQIKSSFFTF